MEGVKINHKHNTSKTIINNVKLRKSHKNKQTANHLMQKIIDNHNITLMKENDKNVDMSKSFKKTINEKDKKEDNDNPVENDAIYSIVEFMRQLGMRKGYIQLKRMLEYCTTAVDDEFVSKISHSS